MQEERDLEGLFLEANKAIDDKDLVGAKQLLEEIIMIDPGFGRAHNHLGWMYDTKFKDFEKARSHYELAVKFCRDNYPVVYVNYAYLLMDFDHHDQALDMIERGLKVNGSDKATLFFQKGKVYENKKQYKKALKYYKEAKVNAYNKDFGAFIDNEIQRVKGKLSFFDKLF